MPKHFEADSALEKMPTGIAGLDDITRGGLPHGRVTLIVGTTGSGKTVLALQTLVNGVRHSHEPGLFVAFEEDVGRIRANAASFDWDWPHVPQDQLSFLDARLPTTILRAGTFDIGGLLAVVGEQARRTRAKRIVFDGIDMLLGYLHDPVLERQELARLNEWLAQRELTALVTAKLGEERQFGRERDDFLQFMADCVILLGRRWFERVQLRDVRILKYRGSTFAGNAFPMLLNEEGVRVSGEAALISDFPASEERVSTGVGRLDAMLVGGYYRGSCVLISGAPGTAKSILAGSFARASAERGERCLAISFEETPEEMMRNLASVGIHVRRWVRSGRLKLVSFSTQGWSSEEVLARIERLMTDFQPRALVVDPLSSFVRMGGIDTAVGIAKRLIHLCKKRGITLVGTTLLLGENPEGEETEIEISTLADTWIHLTYRARAGERNRALTIIKARGTAHSNQVRELVLSNHGVDLSDVYTAGGEVLMGTLRWEKEAEERSQAALQAEENDRRYRELELEETQLQSRILALRQELDNKVTERSVLVSQASERRGQQQAALESRRGLRSADRPNRKLKEPKRLRKGKRPAGRGRS